MEVYSHWLRQAFPQPRQRQQYFKGLIEGKPISHANFRLAHLLFEKQLATLVVTPNFDDLLSRALALFGERPIICDHPATTERIDAESSDIQIVHVHGTYWFYDLCNLPGEIEDRTADSTRQAVTMSSLLNNVLSRHSAIVIGYSGWEGDVIMTALRRRLNSSLPVHMYWFCHRRSDRDLLPQFLREHDNVSAVLPPQQRPISGPRPSADDVKPAASPSESEPALMARSVLDKLVAAFTKSNPPLVDHPIRFFVGQLKAAFPQDHSEKSDDDIYRLSEVIHRVEQAKKAAEKKPATADTQIARVRNAIRRSKYGEAIKAAARSKRKQLTPAQRDTLAELVMSAALGLSDSSQDELDAYDIILALGGAKVASNPKETERTTAALFNKGVTLHQLNRDEEAIAAYDQALSRLRDSKEPALREHAATTLINKAIALASLGRKEASLDAYDELLKRFGASTEPELREEIVNALGNKGIELSQLNRDEEAIQAYDQVVQRFSDATELSMREHVVASLVNKGLSLRRLQRYDEAIAVYSEVVRRFGDSPDPAMGRAVARALVQSGTALRQLNRNEEAIQSYDQLLERYRDATDPELREQADQALFNRALSLAALNRDEEAVQTYDQLIQRIGGGSEHNTRLRIGRSLYNKSLALARANRPEEAKSALIELIKRFGSETEEPLKKLVGLAEAEFKRLESPHS
jgi:tetratricopeptide (TPR) repeat protein